MGEPCAAGQEAAPTAGNSVGYDCRRALLQVLSPQFPDRILATINYGWESAAFYTKWMHGDEEAGGYFILTPHDDPAACADPRALACSYPPRPEAEFDGPSPVFVCCPSPIRSSPRCNR